MTRGRPLELLRRTAQTLGGLSRTNRGRVTRKLLGSLGRAPSPPVPTTVNWQLTYACPLRCEHCYSESGRRPVKTLPPEDLFRIAEKLLQIRPLPGFAFSGGEPTLAPGFLELAERLRRARASVKLYTSGFRPKPELVQAISRTFTTVAVSIDGATRETNDRIRGRAGAFDEALETLGRLDALSRSGSAGSPARFGVEYSVMRSNLGEVERFCTDVAPRFPRLGFLHFGSVVPAGLASRPSFVRRELLNAAELASLQALSPALQAKAPRGVEVRVYSNLAFMMHPEQIRHGRSCDIILEIEADGSVRAMSMYEGVVGNLLEEPFDVLWRRTIERQNSSFVASTLERIRSMEDWGEAARAIDERFAEGDDRSRLHARAPLIEDAHPETAPSPRHPLKVLWP
ncbi:MAG TPA: radical SAM protein [Polyangiaceae bacterium]|nr:radical SAM protein [Polyangiaceae bacterium]